ncbi:glycosyltransferase family 2 protein [Xanthomarina sp. GH4-25]|uniref:glycosyltransferase family 2 protein n=1 Tax=Xanthomarina sp. GH4-25 TaxID=3349335 RepID=UPI0038781C7D
MKDSPLISIIIPCYNGSEFIQKALESVKSQTYSNWECIVINDGSTDASEQIIKETIKENPQFTYHYKSNNGLSEARNTGMNLAQGKFIYFFDSDDLLDSEALENLLLLFEDDIDFVIGKNAITEGQSKQVAGYLEHFSHPFKKLNNTKNKDLIKLVLEYPVTSVVWNKLYRKSFLDKHQLVFKKGILHEDELWFFETLFHAKAIIFNNKATYYYNVANSNSITNDFKLRNLESYLEIIEYINEKYYQNASIDYIREMHSIYITHLKIRVIRYCYKKLNKKDKTIGNSKIKNSFQKVQTTRHKQVLNKHLEEFHYHFRIAEVLESDKILKFLRYFRSPKIFRKIKFILLLQKAKKLNTKNNRVINKVY